MTRVISAILLVFIFKFSLGQSTVNQGGVANKNTLLEEKVKYNEDKVNKAQIQIDKIEANAYTSLKDLKSDINDRINLYIFFITVFIGGIIFLVNLFGKKAIIKRVEEIIGETAQRHIETKIVETLNSKITTDLIDKSIRIKTENEISQILTSIEEKGNLTIDEIRTRGNEAIKSMIAAPQEFMSKNMTEVNTDIEIKLHNDSVRANEFFNLAFNSNDPIIQIELYKKVLEIQPDNFNAHNNISVAYNDLNYTEKAIESATRAIELNTKNYQAYANRAQAYNLEDKLELAIKDIAEAIKIKPNFEYSYAIKGNILTKLGKFKEAEEALNSAVQMNPNSAEAYFNQGFFYEESKKWNLSLESYLKAEVAGFPNKAMLYNNMAVLYRRLNDFEKAIEYVEKARQFNPNFPNIDGTLALIYADKNDEENFYHHLKVALEKGCMAWKYIADPAFDKFRNTSKLNALFDVYKKKQSLK